MPLATPIGHSLLGFVVARFSHGESRVPLWRWYLFAAVAANVPDLDFLPGLFTGNINEFHQGPSHSLAGVALFGLLAAACSKWFHTTPVRFGIFGAMAYGSHLALDLFCHDGRAPFGIPVLWPFSDSHWIAPYTVFSGVKHGVPGDGMSRFFTEVFSLENLITLGLEIVLLTPLLVGAFFLQKRAPAFGR